MESVHRPNVCETFHSILSHRDLHDSRVTNHQSQVFSVEMPAGVVGFAASHLTFAIYADFERRGKCRQGGGDRDNRPRRYCVRSSRLMRSNMAPSSLGAIRDNRSRRRSNQRWSQARAPRPCCGLPRSSPRARQSCRAARRREARRAARSQSPRGWSSLRHR